MSFELKFFVCRHVSIWGFQNRVCLSVRPSVCPHPEKRNHHSFVNISPTLVIDASMERSSRVLHHGNPKIWKKNSKKFEIRNLTFDEELKSPWLRRYQSYISNWYINGKVFTSTKPWEPKNLIFFQKRSKFEFWLLTNSWNHLSFVNISPTLVIIHINGKVFSSTTPWEPRNLIFLKFEIEFDLYFDLCWRA